MKRSKTIFASKVPKKEPSPFLQPLAVALVSAMLLGVALFIGWMDLRALDKTLTGYMEQRALDKIGYIRQSTARYFHLLQHRPPPGLDDFAPPRYDHPFPLQESMIMDLMDWVWAMDQRMAHGDLTRQGLEQMAFGQGIWFLGFFDENGDLTLSNRPPPVSVLEQATAVIFGGKRILIHVFGPPTEEAVAGWMALKKRLGKGSIVLALSPVDAQFWRLRTAVQQALEETDLEEDDGYIVLTDGQGRWLGGMGQIPPDRQEASSTAHDARTDVSDVTLDLGVDGKKLLEISTPVQFDEGLSGVVRMALSRERIDAMLVKEKKRGMVLMAFMGFIALLSMWLLYKNQNRHLRKMRVIEEQLHQAERLSALGRMAAGVAHEIRNPLNAISMACQRLNPENVRQLSSVIRDEIRRLDQIVEDFLSLSGRRKLTFQPHDIRTLLRHIVLLMEEESTSKGVEILCEWDDAPLRIPVDADKITQAFLNIIKNAVEATPGGGTVKLIVTQGQKDWVKIDISDTGRGLTPEACDRIFDPDYTTKEKGLGLGLALAHEIIQGHGGKIQVVSEPDRGTTMAVFLPLKRWSQKG